MQDEILTFNEVKEYLKVSRSTLYNWVHQRKIPVAKMGRFLRFKRSKIDAWLDERERL